MDTIFDLVPLLHEKGLTQSVFDTDFPHVSEKIVTMWGSIECLEYIESLKEWVPTSDRPTRQGFPLHAIIELEYIYEHHIQQFPYMKTRSMLASDCPWSSTTKRTS